MCRGINCKRCWWGIGLMRFVGLLMLLAPDIAVAQIVEFRFNDTGTTSVSTGASTPALTFRDLGGDEADLHSAAGLGMAGDIVGHPDFGTDRSFDNTASLVMQGLGGIALNTSDTSVSQLKSWTVSGWYKTDGEQIFGNGGTVVVQSPVCFNVNCNPGINAVGFAVRGEWGNGFRTSVNGTNTGTGSSGNTWEDKHTWVFFAVTYDGTQSIANLHYYRGYRNATEATTHPVSTTETAFDTLDKGETLPSTGIAIGNRVDDMSRAFDGYLDNIRVFGSRADGSGALTPAQIESIRKTDLAVGLVAGDYDADGVVGLSDFELWKSTYESSAHYMYADGNGDGAVDAADYVVWRDNVPESAGQMASSAASVPEPVSLLTVALAIAFVGCVRLPRGNSCRGR